MLESHDIKLPTDGWTRMEPDTGTWRWRNATDDLLSLDVFAIAPDLPSPVWDLGPIRSMYRGMLGDGGGLVEVEAMELATVPSLRTIFKFPQSLTGMTYLGAVTIPFRDCSFVLKWQCPEHGTTGIRDAVVLATLSPTVSATGEIVGWRQDPYMPSHRARCLRNRADDVQWDARFPDHPLSRLRSYLALLPFIGFSERALHEPPFLGPPK
jgi:hypothetical protein